MFFTFFLWFSRTTANLEMRDYLIIVHTIILEYKSIMKSKSTPGEARTVGPTDSRSTNRHKKAEDDWVGYPTRKNYQR